MKKIIDGRRYDTESAKMIGSCSYGQGYRDFSHWSEELYQKKNGEFFLYGEGGPNTKYAVSVSYNEWSGGEKIMPLSVEAAMKWAEKYLDAEEYEAVFGEVPEDDSKKIVTFSLPVSVVEKIRRAAAEQNTTMSDLIVQMANKQL